MSNAKLGLLVALLGFFLGMLAIACSVSGEKQNLEIIKREVEEVWNNKNYAVVDEILTENYVRHLPGGQDVRGREAYVEHVKYYVVPSPDARFSMDLVITSGDYVIVRYVVSGTHTAAGPPLGPPTGKKWNWTSICIDRLENDKIAECWCEADNESYFRQIRE